MIVALFAKRIFESRRDDIINIQGDNDIPSGFKGIL
jgi:hypothetical protein